MRRIITFVAVVGALLAIARNLDPASSAQQGADLAARFRTEAPRCWEEYMKLADSLYGTWSETSTDLAAPRCITTDRTWTSTRCGQCVSLLKQSRVEGGEAIKSGTLSVINSRYAFELYRKTPDAPWSISAVDLKLEDGISFDIPLPALSTAALVKKPPRYPLATFNVDEGLVDIVKDPLFKVRKVVPVSTPHGVMAKVEFDYPQDTLKAPPPSFADDGGLVRS